MGAGRSTERHTQELWRAEERGNPGKGWQISMAGGVMWWHWDRREGRQGLVLLRDPTRQGWLAVLAGQALAPSANGAFGVSVSSHQAQPSGETVSVVILCQSFMCDTGVMRGGDCT